MIYSYSDQRIETKLLFPWTFLKSFKKFQATFTRFIFLNIMAFHETKYYKNLKKTKQEMLIQFHPKDGSLKKAEKEIVKMTTKKDVNKKIMN